jgi:hypothetical protein
VNGVEVSPWPWLVVNVVVCAVVLCWLVIDIRRELFEATR